jgi:hypothetical protein
MRLFSFYCGYLGKMPKLKFEFSPIPFPFCYALKFKNYVGVEQ